MLEKKKMSEYIRSSLKFWEPARILYNAVMFLIVMAHVVIHYPVSIKFIGLNEILGIVFLAIMANILFCVAYAVDIFLQQSELEKVIKFGRYSILACGILLASIITHFICYEVFSIY